MNGSGSDTNRREAVRRLHEKMAAGEDAREALWEAVIACQGDSFFTSSGLPFSYVVRRRKNGEYSGELIVSRKDHSKTLTKSSVMLAFERVLAQTELSGGGQMPPAFKGPKAIGQIFGISYIYSIFWKMGLIRVPETITHKLKGEV
jgi:hypothetical protein